MNYKNGNNLRSGLGEKSIFLILLISTVVILFGGVFLVSSTTGTPQVTSSENARALVENASYDWGSIPINGGNVKKTFTIKNTGSSTLQLYNVKTSCHCTKAVVSVYGKDSPAFGMSGVSSWVGEVPSGKEAKLTVIFDPAFHGPNGAGPINRFVSVETNDKTNNKLSFSLTGTVVK